MSIRTQRPDGTVTFLLSDVESSSKAWASVPDATDRAMRQLDRTLGAAVREHGGVVLKDRGEGDSHFSVFGRASSAVKAARTIQLDADDLRLRIGIHTGEVRVRDRDYYGIAPNQAARIRSLGHGGQTLLSSVTAQLARAELPGDVELRSQGLCRVRDFAVPVEVYQLVAPGLDDAFPALRTLDAADGLTTVVCLDAVGTAARLTPITDQAVQDWTRQLVSLVGAAAPESGPVFLKFTGDGCFAGFASPSEALSFIERFRLSATAAGIAIRAGLDASCIAHVQGEPVGAAIFGAAQLARRAEPGSTGMSSLMKRLLARQRPEGGR